SLVKRVKAALRARRAQEGRCSSRATAGAILLRAARYAGQVLPQLRCRRGAKRMPSEALAEEGCLLHGPMISPVADNVRKASIFPRLTHFFAGAVSLTPHRGSYISRRAVGDLRGRSSVG